MSYRIFIGHNSKTDEWDLIKTDVQGEIYRDTKGFENYSFLIGQFKTMRGARFMQAYGKNNPHIQHVNDAERLAKESEFKAFENNEVVWIRK